MSATEAWTWISIGVLVFGAPLVFVWFLRDAARLLAGLGEGGRRDGDRGGAGDPGGASDREGASDRGEEERGSPSDRGGASPSG